MYQIFKYIKSFTFYYKFKIALLNILNIISKRKHFSKRIISNKVIFKNIIKNKNKKNILDIIKLFFFIILVQMIHIEGQLLLKYSYITFKMEKGSQKLFYHAG